MTGQEPGRIPEGATGALAITRPRQELPEQHMCDDIIAIHIESILQRTDCRGVLPFVRDGKMRALATTSARRLEWTPEVPTVEEQGVRPFDVPAWHGLFGPANLPPPILDRIYRALTTALNDPQLRPRLNEQGLEPVGMSPADFRPWLEGDIAKWREVVRVANIRPD